MRICVPVIVHNIALAQLPQEVLIVSDNDKLEVGVILPFVDNAGQDRQTSEIDSC